MSAVDILVKLTPLHAVAQRLGAQLVERHGWQIPEVYTDLKGELAAARQGVALVDQSPRGKIAIEGAAADQIVRAVYGVDDLVVGSGVAVEDVRIWRLRPDVFFVSTIASSQQDEYAKLSEEVEAQEYFVTLSDGTHGQSEILVVGPAAAALLRKVCGLDFRDEVFADGQARQTSVAKVNQLIIRRDLGTLPAYALIGARSLGEYLWGVLQEAGQEWDLTPIGWAALDSLVQK